MSRRTLLAAAVPAALTAPSLTAPGRIAPSLTTLAWRDRRAAFFRTELLAELCIPDPGKVSPARTTSGHAGALRGEYV